MVSAQGVSGGILPQFRMPNSAVPWIERHYGDFRGVSAVIKLDSAVIPREESRNMRRFRGNIQKPAVNV